jgi:hypothetical protein
VPDSLLKGANNEKLVRHVRTLNPTAKIVATADLLFDVGDLYEAGANYVTVTRLCPRALHRDRGRGRRPARQARRGGRAAQRAAGGVAVAAFMAGTPVTGAERGPLA